MVTLYVTYSGDESSFFDREYWIEKHMPLVRETWAPYGLVSTRGFFPSGDGGGLVAICPCIFRDEAAVRCALTAPETQRVMDDIQNITAIEPDHKVARAL